jgi:hypothetical protein
VWLQPGIAELAWRGGEQIFRMNLLTRPSDAVDIILNRERKCIVDHCADLSMFSTWEASFLRRRWAGRP